MRTGCAVTLHSDVGQSYQVGAPVHASIRWRLLLDELVIGQLSWGICTASLSADS